MIMEYKKVKYFLDNTPNKSSNFRTKVCVEANGGSSETKSTNSQIRYKTSRLKSRFCDYSDAYILVCGTITITGAWDDAAARQVDIMSKKLIFKNCALFTDYISEIYNIQVENLKRS